MGRQIVLAVKGSAAEEVLDQAGIANLAGKTMIDTTNPIAQRAARSRRASATSPGPNDSLMERLQKKAPHREVRQGVQLGRRRVHGQPEVRVARRRCSSAATMLARSSEVTEILDEVRLGSRRHGRRRGGALRSSRSASCGASPGFLRNDWSARVQDVEASEVTRVTQAHGSPILGCTKSALFYRVRTPNSCVHT